MAAAPAPANTTLICPMSFFRSSSALSSAAPEMIAVPCWSSWNTGIESDQHGDRKSTRLNSSHTVISYAVFCLKKKKKQKQANELDKWSHRDKSTSRIAGIAGQC